MIEPLWYALMEKQKGMLLFVEAQSKHDEKRSSP